MIQFYSPTRNVKTKSSCSFLILFISLLRVLCTFDFVFLVEELLSTVW